MDVDARRLLRALVWTAYGALLALGLPPALILAWVAETAPGRAAAGLCLALAAWPLALHRRMGGACAAWPRPYLRLLSAGLPLAALALGAFVLWSAPDGTPPAGSTLRSRRSSGTYAWWSPFNLVPELDQVKLGAVLAPDLFARIDRGKTRRILDLTVPLYRAMEADPAYRAAGSAMHLAFRDVFLHGDAAGHYFAYVPPGRHRVLLFLHGSGGNFKSYCWFWQQYAESRRIAVICPSYGFGDWGRAEAQGSLDRLLEQLDRDPALDTSDVTLAGLSSGGRGASLLAARHPGRFRALALFSPVMDAAVLEDSSFCKLWSGRKVLVMHGDADEVIPAAYVAGASDRLLRSGVRVNRVELPGEDHFLLFSARDRVHAEMDALR